MAKLGPYNITEEKLQDISAGRARLAAFKASIEKYPSWPEEPVSSKDGQTSIPKMTPVRNRLDQLQSMCITTHDTLLDHIKGKGKKQSKEYKGIKE